MTIPISRTLSLLASAALAVTMLSSCATAPKQPALGVVYPSSSVEKVTVLSRSEERVSASNGRVGGSAGSIAGGVGGGFVGSILGGLVGPTVENAVVKEKVSRYVLRQENGNRISFLQDDTDHPIPIGSAAYLIKHPERGTATLAPTPPKTG